MKDMVKELGSRNPFTPKRSLSDEYNRLALDRVKSIKSILQMKGLREIVF